MVGTVRSSSNVGSVRWAMWLLLALAAAACVGEDSAERSAIESYPPVRDSLRAQLFATSPVMGLPSGIAVDGPRIWVGDYAGDPEVHVFDAVSGELTASLGRRGDGSGEFRGRTGGFQTVPGDDGAIWIFDPSGQRVVRVEHGVPSTDWRAVALEIPPYVMRIAWLDAATMVGVTSREDAMWVFFDSVGTRIRSVSGSLPGSERIPMQERLKAAITAFGICPGAGGGGFIRYYQHFGRIEIFRPDATEPTAAEVPFPSDPIFRADPEGEVRFAPNRIHYVGCATGDSHYYVVYSGIPLDAQSPGADAGDHVHVFDMEGGLQRVMHLDTPIGKIAVDEREGWLYGTSDQEGSVYRFRLPTG